MTPRQLAQEVTNASRDRRHDDVQRYLQRLVQLAEQGARHGNAQGLLDGGAADQQRAVWPAPIGHAHGI